MRVGVEPNMGCGTCRYCRLGLVHLCPNYKVFGLTEDGGFAQYVKISAMAIYQGNMVPFDEHTSFEEAALVEPLSCCYNSLEAVRTSPGDSVLIVGAGPMGVLHLQLQRLAGAGIIMVADISQKRLEQLRRFKPDVSINTQKQELSDAVMRYTNGQGADVIITACPSPEIQKQSVHLAAKLGRISLFGGLPKGKEQVEINTNLIHYNGIIMTGTTQDYHATRRNR